MVFTCEKHDPLVKTQFMQPENKIGKNGKNISISGLQGKHMMLSQNFNIKDKLPHNVITC